MRAQSNRVFPRMLLVEVFLIVLGVLLGLFFNEMRLQQKNHDRAQVALKQINSEMQYNQGQVADIASHHIAVRDSLIVLMSQEENRGNPLSLQEIVGAIPGGFGFVRLQRHAWSLAVELGTLENMDYRIATELSRVYDLQGLYLDSYTYLSENGFLASNLSSDSRDGLLMALFLNLNNITHLEEDLLATYEEVLKEIEVDR